MEEINLGAFANLKQCKLKETMQGGDNKRSGTCGTFKSFNLT